MGFLSGLSSEIISVIFIIAPIILFVLFFCYVGKAIKGLLEIKKHKKNQVSRYNKLKSFKLNSITDVAQIPDNYVVLDLATTGLDPVFDDIIEVGVVKVVNNKPTSYYKHLIRPRVPVTEEITKLTNISFSMVKKKPYIEKVTDEITNFIGDLPIVCHNADFVMKFLYTNSSTVMHNKSIDTLYFAKLYVRGMNSYKLSTLTNALCLEKSDYHRSLNDCFVIHKLLVELQERAAEEDGKATKKEE